MRLFLKTKQDERGFTLVELLVVILILGVLAAVAIPAYGAQREKARIAALESDLHNVAMTIQTWSIAHPNERMPINGGWVFVLSDKDGPRFSTSQSITGPQSFRDVAPVLSEGSSVAGTSPANTGKTGTFCLVGNMINTPYDFQGNDRSKVNRSLYYNFSNDGGSMKTPAELVPGDACYSYYNTYNR